MHWTAKRRAPDSPIADALSPSGSTLAVIVTAAAFSETGPADSLSSNPPSGHPESIVQFCGKELLHGNRAVIERVIPASRVHWLDYCNACPGATFFHTPYWTDLFERSLPRRFTAAPLLFRFDDGATALLPLVVKSHIAGFVRIVCSMPAGTYGGWLSPHTLSEQQDIAIMDHLAGNADLVFRENPYCPVRFPSDKYEYREDHTQTIDLSAGYDAVWMRSTAAHRNAVRNARRSSVEVSEAENSSEWEEYYTIYNSSIDRWRRRSNFTGVRYDRPFFREIERTAPLLRKLWLAKVNGKIIAGILCFYWKNHVVVWHGAGMSEYFSYHPNNYLYDRAIAHAADAGYSWFDCNPSGGLTGVDNFKRYLGAQPLRSRVFIRRAMLTNFAGMLRQAGRRRGE